MIGVATYLLRRTVIRLPSSTGWYSRERLDTGRDESERYHELLRTRDLRRDHAVDGGPVRGTEVDELYMGGAIASDAWRREISGSVKRTVQTGLVPSRARVRDDASRVKVLPASGPSRTHST